MGTPGLFWLDRYWCQPPGTLRKAGEEVNLGSCPCGSDARTPHVSNTQSNVKLHEAGDPPQPWSRKTISPADILFASPREWIPYLASACLMEHVRQPIKTHLFQQRACGGLDFHSGYRSAQPQELYCCGDGTALTARPHRRPQTWPKNLAADLPSISKFRVRAKTDSLSRTQEDKLCGATWQLYVSVCFYLLAVLENIPSVVSA